MVVFDCKCNTLNSLLLAPKHVRFEVLTAVMVKV